jgi:hypothetical protein
MSSGAFGQLPLRCTTAKNLAWALHKRAGQEGDLGAEVALPEFIGEPILVQARFLPGGAVQPVAFIWRNRTRYITAVGREWEEESEGIRWRCYLVQTPTAETFDLRLDTAGMRWVLARAWLKAGPGA